MFCKNCGSQMTEGTNFCPSCGSSQSAEMFGANANKDMPKKTPKCTSCGYVGEWKLGPLLRPIDFVIGIAFLFLGIVPGLIYIGVVAAVRANPQRREKICPHCNSRNLWTFIY